MNSVNQFIKLIVVFIPIVTLANGILITVDGQCEHAPENPEVFELNPSELILFSDNDTYYVVGVTFPGPINRTDIKVRIFTEGEHFDINITKQYRSTVNDKCEERVIYLEVTDRRGVYNVLYQIEPNSDPVKMKGYLLAVTPFSTNWGDISTFSCIFYFCRNLSDSKKQVELLTLSLLTELSPRLREDNKLEIISEGLDYLLQYLEPVEQSDNPCDDSNPLDNKPVL